MSPSFCTIISITDNGTDTDKKNEVVQRNVRPLFFPFIVLVLSLKVSTGTFDIAKVLHFFELTKIFVEMFFKRHRISFFLWIVQFT